MYQPIPEKLQDGIEKKVSMKMENVSTKKSEKVKATEHVYIVGLSRVNEEGEIEQHNFLSFRTIERNTIAMVTDIKFFEKFKENNNNGLKEIFFKIFLKNIRDAYKYSEFTRLLVIFDGEASLFEAFLDVGFAIKLNEMGKYRAKYLLEDYSEE